MPVDSYACWLCGGGSSVDEVYREIPYYRCHDCGLLFAPQRERDDLHEIYSDEYFENYPGNESYGEDEPQRRFEAKQRIVWIQEYVSKGSVLEVGAANGIFLDEMRSVGFEVFGVEPAAGMASEAKSRFDVDVRAGFLETVELPSDTFDIICAWHVLEHISKPLGSMKRLREVIADDGTLFLEIPNILSSRAKHDGTRWFNLDPANHVAFYTPDQMRVLLDQAGFEMIDCYSVSGLSYYRPANAIKPLSLLGRAYSMLISRRLQGRPDPIRHELLRVVARPSKRT